MVCATIIITQQNTQENNTSLHNTTNTALNNTTNTTFNNSNSQEQTTTKTQTKQQKTSSSEKVDTITTYDSKGNVITKKGVWVGRDQAGAHIYKDPNTGELFGKSGAKYKGSTIYPK